jgi:hypothetical protein
MTVYFIILQVKLMLITLEKNGEFIGVKAYSEQGILIRKLVNLKLKDGRLVAEHLSEFQSCESISNCEYDIR